MTKTTVQRQFRPRVTGLVYLCINGLLGLAAMHSQVNLLFWMFGLMVSGLILALIYGGLNLRGVELERRCDDRSRVGGVLCVRYTLANRKSILPLIGIRIRELDAHEDGRLGHRPQTWATHVGPSAAVPIEVRLAPERRGPLWFKRVEVSTAFPLGLARWSKIFVMESETLVYPQIHRLRPGAFEGQAGFDLVGIRAGNREGGHEEFYGLREYQDGDPIRQIDWKHTARTGNLVSRELTRPDPPSVMVMLDLTRNEDQDRAERAIAFAASLIRHAISSGLEVGLTVVGTSAQDHAPARSTQHVSQMLRTLALLTPGEGGSSFVQLPASFKGRCIVIHAAVADLFVAPRGATRLSVEQMERWVVDSPERSEVAA